MSEMSEIDQVHLRAVMLCMSEMSEIVTIFKKQVMSKNISDNNNAAMLLMSHVRDIRDVKYLNKRSKATLYKAMLLMLEMLEM